jgi:hypothetical protein
VRLSAQRLLAHHAGALHLHLRLRLHLHPRRRNVCRAVPAFGPELANARSKPPAAHLGASPSTTAAERMLLWRLWRLLNRLLLLDGRPGRRLLCRVRARCGIAARVLLTALFLGAPLHRSGIARARVLE